MARPLRIEFPGAIYHVASGCDGREPIVLGDDDREDLLIVLGQALHRFDACALAWCLMDNHWEPLKTSEFGRQGTVTVDSYRGWHRILGF